MNTLNGNMEKIERLQSRFEAAVLAREETVLVNFSELGALLKEYRRLKTQEEAATATK